VSEHVLDRDGYIYSGIRIKPESNIIKKQQEQQYQVPSKMFILKPIKIPGQLENEHAKFQHYKNKGNNVDLGSEYEHIIFCTNAV